MRIVYLPLILCAMLVSFCAYGQDNRELDLYSKKTIHLYSDFCGDGYVRNGEMMPCGRFGASLAGEVAGSKYAVLEMQKVGGYKKKAMATGIAASALGIAEAILEFTDTRYSDRLSISVPLIIGSVVLGTISKGYGQLAAGAMSRAVWIYNRALLFHNVSQ